MWYKILEAPSKDLETRVFIPAARIRFWHPWKSLIPDGRAFSTLDKAEAIIHEVMSKVQIENFQTKTIRRYWRP